MTKVGRREKTSIESGASAFCEPFPGICQRVEGIEREQPFLLHFYRGYCREKLTRKEKLKLERNEVT